MSFLNNLNFRQCGLCLGLISFAIITCLAGPGMAKDTDVYQVNAKNNAYVLMDTSGSMEWAIYDKTKDYAAIYDYFYEMSNVDDVADGNFYYSGAGNNHKERTKIYLVRGDVGVTTATIDGETVAFTGDGGAASEWDGPNTYITWRYNTLVDTHTILNADRTFSDDGTGLQRLDIDGQGYVTFDGDRLELGQDILLDDHVRLPDDTIIYNGFGGMLQAPGFYFSGYSHVTPVHANTVVADSGDDDIFFFVTGNWFNFQTIFNLEFTSGTHDGEPAWVHETYDPSSATVEWATVDKDIDYPSGSANYVPRERFSNNRQAITHPGALKIRVHFSLCDLHPQGGQGDYVTLQNASNVEVARYNRDTIPADGWSPVVDGDTVWVGLTSNNNNSLGAGFTIDQIEVLTEVNSGTGEAVYKIQTRLEAATIAYREALIKLQSKMNWGFATFNRGNGATIENLLDPSLDDSVQRQNIENSLDTITAGGGTPLGEALQDVFEEGYYDQRSALSDIACRKNFIISVTDGYPSADYDWSRISGVPTFTDIDGDGWTQDPLQTTDPDYYDDVAHWIYTNNFKDKTPVADPENSYFNVATHHIAFGSHSPIMHDAASQSGGLYFAANNSEQLAAVFYAIAMTMTDAVAFTAPVVSVDAANKIQNGDDLFLGLFLPQGTKGWVGNLKKYKLGDGSADRPNVWWLYDGGNNEAIDDQGNFLDNGTAFWADDNDANDIDVFGGHDVKEDGVGEVLSEQVVANYDAGNFYIRPIYTYLGGVLTKFEQGNAAITNTVLGVANDQDRYEIINYVHGYHHQADATTGNPTTGAREWALGSIVHSSPVVVDYYNSADITILDKRYIVVGANDGMLHVFDDENGQEVFAFVPPEMLTNLQLLPQQPMVDMVDGDITLYRQNKDPKYLVFGLRRGGDKYWCLDVSDINPLNWTVKWSYSPADAGQSWSKPQITSIPVDVDGSTGEVTFKDIMIVSGGYDPMEDNFPEPFLDEDNNGNPFAADGSIIPAEWNPADANQDVFNNDSYDKYNPGMNTRGRGIFAVDLEDPTNQSSVGSDRVLPFSVTYDANDLTTGNQQTLRSMKYCFPATPAVVTTGFAYYYKDTGIIKEARRNNVLEAIYATDIYANLYKLVYKFEIKESSGTYSVGERGWTVTHVFSGNPGSLSRSSEMGMGEDGSDQGRKTFYAPAISWGGAGEYFDQGNYGFAYTTFSGRFDIAALYFGTGDREHPTYTMTRDRFYAVYDDSSITAVNDSNGADVIVSTVPYKENHLLNLSCDELDENTLLSGVTKEDLKELLLDDADYVVGTTRYIEDGADENDAKGWYIILEDQGDASACSHCTYAGAVNDSDISDRDNHDNEKILSQVGLFAEVLYFTSYQPAKIDECNPQGNGFAYSLNYADGTAAYNMNDDNDDSGVDKKDVTDRYKKITKIYGIPSEFAIVTRKGEAGAMAMMGGRIIGPKKDGYRIKSPGMGLELFYWREGNSQQPPPPPAAPGGPTGP